jgi:Protein kinase domain.
VVEFYTGHPLFTGDSEHDQLLYIIEVLGIPPENVLKMASRTRLFFEPSGYPKIVANKKGAKKIPGSRKLTDILAGASDDLIDFVSKCLDWNPETRLKPHEALKHPWIAVIKKIYHQKPKFMKKKEIH